MTEEERMELAALAEKHAEERKCLMKEAFKETVHEWLEDQFAAFGKWTLVGLASAGFAGLVYLLGWHGGWGPPQ